MIEDANWDERLFWGPLISGVSVAPAGVAARRSSSQSVLELLGRFEPLKRLEPLPMLLP
jgi:hypothetical protein